MDNSNIEKELQLAYYRIEEKYNKCEEPWIECNLMYKKLKRMKHRNIFNKRYIDKCIDKLEEYDDIASYYEHEELLKFIDKCYHRIGYLFS